MNCNEFRQLCAADPHGTDDERREHLAACLDCAEYAEQMKRFEHSLAEAVNVELPPGLGRRIQRRHRGSDGRARFLAFLQGPVWRPTFALMATVLLLIGVGVKMFQESPAEWLRPQAVISYMLEQRPAGYSGRSAPDDEVEKMFRYVGARQVGKLGEINYCHVARLQDYRVAYMVLAGDHGPVSVMLIADSRLKQPYSLDRNGLVANLVPVTKGTMAIMGRQEENLPEVENRLRNAIQWI